MSTLNPSSNKQPNLDIEQFQTITYSQFQHNAANLNRPFIAGPALTAAWPCIKNWRQISGNDSQTHEHPNFSALREYSHHTVQVADCSTRRYNEFDRTERRLGEVLDLWERQDENSRKLYVKDWHQALLLEQDGGKQDQIYTTPDIFKDDWMTHHALTLDPPDDYRFAYVGPKGTFTPLHRDVYGSYSWSSNILGRKRWWLIPPEYTDLFRIRKGNEDMVFDIRDLSEEIWKGRVMVVEQEAGETIFVPSGWYHQVENLDFCISINQNFASSHIIPTIYRNLLQSQARVEDAIDDVKIMLRDHAAKQPRVHGGGINEDVEEWEVEWLEQVQKLLEMDAGWGLRGFWAMVAYNLQNPPVDASLRPSDEYVHAKIRPVVEDFRRRREYVVLKDLRRLVDDVALVVGLD